DLYCWGDNTYGQLGTGSKVSFNYPTVVHTNLPTSSVATGGYHTCAVTVTGAVACWGANADGELGNGTKTDSSTPAAVSTLSTDAVAIAAAGAQSCAVMNDGRMMCWGFGTLGDGSGVPQPSPVPVQGL